jgi:hypothetical protein
MASKHVVFIRQKGNSTAMTIERNIYRIMLLAAIGYILFLQMCGTVNKCPDQTVTSVKVDTGYIVEQFKSKWQKPKPDTVIKAGKIPAPRVLYLDTGSVKIAPVDTATILQDYFSKVFYRDSLQTQYGTITVEDTITENRIQARRWFTNFTIPTITKTVTLSTKPRSQLYAGFSGLFGQQNIGAELNFTLKTKKDQQYEIGAGLFGAQPYGRIGTKFKLSFR